MIPIDRARRLRIRRWHGCYDDFWKDLIVPEAFAHPAKFSRGLIERIVMHCIERGWLKPGDAVVDPFGGVSLGGIICGYHNIHWLGVELESRFCELGDCGYECDGTVEWAEVEEPATEPIPDCPGGGFAT